MHETLWSRGNRFFQLVPPASRGNLKEGVLAPTQGFFEHPQGFLAGYPDALGESSRSPVCQQDYSTPRHRVNARLTLLSAFAGNFFSVPFPR